MWFNRTMNLSPRHRLLCLSLSVQVKKAVGRPECEGLVNQLHEYLSGEKDGVPKVSKHILRLHLRLSGVILEAAEA